MFSDICCSCGKGLQEFGAEDEDISSQRSDLTQSQIAEGYLKRTSPST